MMMVVEDEDHRRFVLTRGTAVEGRLVNLYPRVNKYGINW